MFSKNLADKPIYHVLVKDPAARRPFNWRERDYYYECKREGGNYGWFKNNLSSAEGSPRPGEITSAWTFGGKWNPESTTGPEITKYIIDGDSVLFFFNEHITIIGSSSLKTSTGKKLEYYSGGGSNTLKFVSNAKLTSTDLKNLGKPAGGKVLGTIASVSERPASFKIN